jgi:hypothetical protein
MLIPMGILAASGAGVAGSYELISTAFGTGSSGTVTFSSIPNSYKHLQIRYAAQPVAGTNLAGITLRFNGDTGTNYSRHSLNSYGSGTPLADGNANRTTIDVGFINGSTTNGAASGILDILNYANTSLYKTTRTLSGITASTLDIRIQSGNWRNTNAVTSIELFIPSGNFNTASRFSIYGIKGA